MSYPNACRKSRRGTNRKSASTQGAPGIFLEEDQHYLYTIKYVSIFTIYSKYPLLWVPAGEYLPGLDPGFFQHVLQTDRSSAAPFALVGRLHEDIDFQRRRRIDGRNPGLEELHDPGDQGRIAAEAPQRRDGLTPEDGSAVSPLSPSAARERFPAGRRPIFPPPRRLPACACGSAPHNRAP